jgi:hypothetical protein
MLLGASKSFVGAQIPQTRGSQGCKRQVSPKPSPPRPPLP